MKNITSVVIGIVLILFGALGILSSFDVISLRFYEFWPFILLVVGLIFEIGYFVARAKDPGHLIPGGILITVAAIFIVCVLLGWHMMELLWPLFIMAPGVGLFQYYIFGGRELGVLIPSLILLGFGGSFIVNELYDVSSFSMIFSLLIILIGAVILLKKDKKPAQDSQNYPPYQGSDE